MDTPRSPGKTKTVAGLVISNQTPPSTCTHTKGINTLHVLDFMQFLVKSWDCLTLPVLPLTFSLRLCLIQTLSSVMVSPVSPYSQRLRADRISTAACLLMPGQPPHRATSTSTRQRRTARSATPSATVWKQTSGRSWEQGTKTGQLRFQTHRDPTLPALLRRYVLGLNRVLLSF